LDADLDGTQTNNQAKGFDCIADSQANSCGGQSLSKAIARVDDGTAQKKNCDEDPNIGAPPFSRQNKRKRSQSCDDYDFDSQMADSSSEQSHEDLHSAKRQKPSHPSRNGLVPNCPSISGHDCPVPHYDTFLEMDSSNGNNASNDNGDKDNEDTGHIDSDYDVRNEDGDGDDCDGHDDRAHSNKLLESTVCLALSSRQVSNGRHDDVPPHKVGALGREDDSGEAE